MSAINKNKEAIPFIKPESKFDINGITGVIERQEDALKIAAIIAGYKYTIKNHYLSDIGAGLYTMLTQKQGLYDVREVGTRDKQGNFEATGARITCSLSTLYKAAFGPLVNNNGNAIDGAGGIIHEAKKHIMPIINGTAPMPRAYASIYKNEKQKDGTFKEIKAVIEGEPIRVYRKVSGARDALIVDLDYFFFPAIEKGDFLKAGDLYIHQVAGLTSFLQLGAKIQRGGKKSGSINVTIARKIILSAQAAYELRYFAPDIIKENQSGRINISLRRGAVRDLYPSSVDNQGYIRYKQFSEAVGLAGQYYNNAIEATGIKDELIKKGKIIIPATNRGAEFPKEHPQIVYIKADKVK